MEVTNYADDFVICGQAPAAAMRAAVQRTMERLRLPLNATKTRCVRVPEDPLEFLGFHVAQLQPAHGPGLHRYAPVPGSVLSV